MKKIYVVLLLSLIVSLSPWKSYAESGNSEDTVILDNSNFGIVQAEESKMQEDFCEIIDAEAAFSKKAVRINSTGSLGLTMKLMPRAGDDLILWLRYSAVDEKSNGIYINVTGKDKSFVELAVTGNKYNWIRLDSVISKAYEPVTVEIEAIEKGVVIDCLVSTNNSHFMPIDNEDEYKLKMDLTLQPMQGLPAPLVTPREGHPRVLFTKEDIPLIKSRLTHPENERSYERWQTLLNYEGDGRLKVVTAGNNKDDVLMDSIEALAFSYAINGNEEHGKRALELCKNMLSTFFADSSQIYHMTTNNIWISAIVYDWCYPLLTQEDRLYLRYYVEQMIKLTVATHPYPYDPIGTDAGVISSSWTVTHPFRDDLAFAIASYDEYPDLYNYIASLLINEYAPAADYWIKGESMPAGTTYGFVRWYAVAWAQRLMKVATDFEPFKAEYENVMLQWIYESTPEGQYFRSGDDVIAALSDSDSIINRKSYTSAFLIAADDAESPYLKSVYKYYAQLTNTNFASYMSYFNSFTPVHCLILNNPDIEAKDYTNLPLSKYFGSPTGRMIARTGWNSGVDTNDAIAYMHIGEEKVMNHQHFDSGSFQLYYKGLLLPDLGHYSATNIPQYYYFTPRTVSHNALLIKDPDELKTLPLEMREADPGNQRFISDQQKTINQYIEDIDEYKTAEVTAFEFGPDKLTPEYTYISGDITNAYTDKVEDVRRYMMFMPTGIEESPAVMMVFDKVKSQKEEFRKKMILQAYEEPIVEGSAVTFPRSVANATGAVTCQILAPSGAVIEKVGGIGKQWFVEGTNYNIKGAVAEDSLEYGWGKIEVSPSESNELDYFFNAMYVHDTQDKLELRKAEAIETESHMGAKLLNKLVMFPKGSERISSDIEFTIPGTEKTDVAVTGLSSGCWEVSVNKKSAGEYYSTEEGGMIYFKAEPGEVNMKYISGTVKNAFTENNNAFNFETAKPSPIELRFNGVKRYSENPLTIKNGNCYIPFESFFGNMDAEISFSEDLKSVTAKANATEITYTLGSSKIRCMRSGINSDFDCGYPIEKENGSFMIPLRSTATMFGGTVSWYNYPRTVDIAINTEIQKSDIEGLVPVSTAYCMESSTETAYTTFDNNPETVWACSGDGAWVIWELPYVADIKAFVYDSNRSITDRQYIFDLYASADGENYSLVYSGNSNPDGTPLAINLSKAVKAKYFKFVGHTNTKPTLWNNIAEMQFYDRKISVSDIK